MTRRSIKLFRTAAVSVAIACALVACDGGTTGQNAAGDQSSAVQSTAGGSVSGTTDAAGTTADSLAVTMTSEESSMSEAAGGDGKCANLTGQEALEMYKDTVPPPFPRNTDPVENHWSSNSPTDTYDPCAKLSWIVLKIDGGTASSPHQVLIFRRGHFLTRITEEAFAFEPVEITRIHGDSGISITFRYTLDGESNAESSGRISAGITLDDSEQQITRTGDVPPGSKWAM